MSTEDHWAVCRGTGKGYVVRQGPVALTASAAAHAYADQLREGIEPSLQLSHATLEAMARARQRLDAERAERDRERQLEERRAHRERVGLRAWAAAQEW